MKLILLFCYFIFIGLGNNPSVAVHPKKEKKVQFTEKDTVLFSSWLHDQLIEREFYSENKGSNYISIHDFIYLDTNKQIITLNVKIAFNKRGWVTNCRVEGMPDQGLNKEAERIVKSSPRWVLKKDGNCIQFKLELPVKGNISSLDRGIVRFFNWWRGLYGMPDYVDDVNRTIPQNEQGSKKVSIIVDKKGELSDIRCLVGGSPDEVYLALKRYRYTRLLEGQNWYPAILNGNPITVKVIIECHNYYKERVYWNYYLIKNQH